MSTRHTILIIIALILNAVLVTLTYLDYKNSEKAAGTFGKAATSLERMEEGQSEIIDSLKSIERSNAVVADFILNLELK